MTVLPQASAAAIARVPRMTGAFHGAMPRTTPAGWRTAIDQMPGLSDGMTSPVIWVVRAAASRKMPAARWTLKPAQGAVAPVSSSISLINSLVRLSIRSAAFRRRPRRSEGPVSDQVSNALAAAATTFSTSASVAAGARVATLPVMGSLRSKVSPPSAATAPPSTINPISIDTLLIFKSYFSELEPACCADLTRQELPTLQSHLACRRAGPGKRINDWEAEARLRPATNSLPEQQMPPCRRASSSFSLQTPPNLLLMARPSGLRSAGDRNDRAGHVCGSRRCQQQREPLDLIQFG